MRWKPAYYFVRAWNGGNQKPFYQRYKPHAVFEKIAFYGNAADPIEIPPVPVGSYRIQKRFFQKKSVDSIESIDAYAYFRVVK